MLFTVGRIIVRGKLVARGQGKKVDDLLDAIGKTPIAMVEAKDNSKCSSKQLVKMSLPLTLLPELL